MNVRCDFYTQSEIAEILDERLETQRLSLNLIQATAISKIR